jgi:selenocysteine-specific elongation factor
MALIIVGELIRSWIGKTSCVFRTTDTGCSDNQAPCEATWPLPGRTDHVPALDAKAEEAISKIREDAAKAVLEPLSAKDWAQRLSIEPDLFRDPIAYLERGQEIIRAPGDLFFDAGVIDSLKQRVIEHLTAHDELDTKTYKDVIGTSRRTAMPLMELLDDLHVTRRMGDVRVLRKG